MSETVEQVWRGPEALRPFLLPLDALEPFPGNPRRGDVENLRESLREFGQLFTVLVDPALGDGGRRRIVARHHLVEAAREEGWTHVAVLENEFENEEQARKFLVGDNRSGQLGGFDEDLLFAQLEAIRDLRGTGYTENDRDELGARLAQMRQPVFPESPEAPALDARSGTTGFFEVPLRLDRDQRRDFAQLVAMLKREWQTDDTTAVVLRSVREAAERA